MDSLYDHQFNFNLKMQELHDIYFKASEQHKSATNLQMQGFYETMKILEKFCHI